MASDDWYRHSTWTDADKEDFQTRLKRARKRSRPQYLRIQACHLAGAGLHVEALKLLDAYFADAENKSSKASAWLQRAESYAAIGNKGLAIESFRSSLQEQRDRPNEQTTAWLDYPWFIVELNLVEQFDEATAVLEEFLEVMRLSLPRERYEFNAVIALILEYHGDRESAVHYAQLALKASEEQHSGYRYHPKVGLVENPTGSVYERLQALVRE